MAPDGAISEGEEFGFHGVMASGLVADLCAGRGLSYAQDDFDECIADAKRLGFVRISTFHGSGAMHLDYDAGAATVAALRATERLMRDYRDFFSEYVFEFENGAPKEFVADAGAARARIRAAAARAPRDLDPAALADLPGRRQSP